ncbi:MAG: DNA cytosine methyltransferase [Parcubacteria group bacterium]
MKLRLLDLFSGIGAYSLGLERTGGFEPVAFCEINTYCRQGEQGRPIAHGNHTIAYADRLSPVGTAIARAERVSWEPEPDVVRVVHGAPNRVERIHALGNLNPPIIPEIIGRAILEALQPEQEAA